MMIEDLNEDVIKNDSKIEELNNTIIDDDSVNDVIVDNNISNENQTSIIENIDDTLIDFTPVVSDGIKEEILDLNEDSHEELIEDLNNHETMDNNLLDEEVINSHDSNNEVDVINNDDDTNKIVDSVEKIDNNETDFSNIDELNKTDSQNTEIVVENSEIYNDFTNVELNDKNEQENEVVKTEEDNNNIDDNNEDNSTANIVVIESKQEISNDVEEEKNNHEPEVKEDTLLEKYGENFSVKEYICNPAIGRDNEIKQLILTLLTPEKSGILVGKPGIGKTAIVEGLGYQIQKGNIPDALKDYQIYKLNTSSLLGLMPGTNEPKIQVLLNEIKGQKKLILFIDEIHTLIGAGAEGDDSLDFANIFKPGLDRGNIKIIGATTTDEYDRYILTDKAFVRRFQKIEVLEPTKEHTVKILMGSLPKLEHKTGAKLKYTPFVQEKIMTFIVDLTTEYRRVYELSARYPDVALTILQQAFSYAVFDNKKEVGIRDVRKAICNTKLVYPDVIKKELIRFNDVFSDIYLMETPQRLKGETSI